MISLGFGALLVAIWLLLWGSASPANVVGGVAVVALLLAFLPDTRLQVRRPTVRPVATARFLVRVGADIFRANAVVTREIVSRGSSIHTGVVAVPLPGSGEGTLTVVANVLALTPGTLPVHVSLEPPIVYIHVLHLHDIEAVRRDVQHLADLAVRAFGPPAALRALGDDEAAAP